MLNTKKFLRFFFGVPITILAFLFMGKLIFDSRSTILSSFNHLNVFVFLLGIFFFAFFFMIKSLVWIRILKQKGFNIPLQSGLITYSLSETKRYVPGNIFAFVSRINTLSSKIPKKETLKAIGIEAVLLALSALIVSIPAFIHPILKNAETNSMPPTLPALFTFVAVILGIFLILMRFSKIVKLHFENLLLLVIAWIFYAIGAILVAHSIAYVYPDNMVFIMSFFVLAWLIGYLSFITPMGLGVRELFITGALSVFFPVAIASILAILTRIAMIVGEILFIFLSYMFSKVKKNSFILRFDTYLVIVIFSVVLYSLFFINYTFLRYKVYISGRFDLGNMSQTVWNTANGKFLLLTNPDGTEQISRLAIHTDVFLALLSPLYYIWSDPRMLLIIQTVILSMGSIFVFLIGKITIKNKKISLMLALSFLLNFWVQYQNIFDFHTVTLATTFLLAAFYFLIKKKWLSMTLFLLLASLTKENVFLVVSVFGLYILFKEKKIILGTVLTVLPLAIFYYIMTSVIPQARGNTHFALSYYSYIGDSTQGILKNLLLKPQIALKHLISLSTVNYLQQLVLPVGFLAVLSPVFLIFTLPDLAINLLSTNENLRSNQYHYGAVIIPFIYIATIYSVRLLLTRYKRLNANLMFYYLLSFSLISFYLYSPLPGTRVANYSPFYEFAAKKMDNYLSVIPATASVSSSNNIASHLSHRDKIYVIPNGIKTADFIVLYNELPTALQLIDVNNYDLIVQDKDFYIFERKSSEKVNTKR